MIVLAGDIGGTKTWLQIIRCDGDGLSEVFGQRYASGQYATFEALLADFLNSAKHEKLEDITAVCIGVAGPVESPELGVQVAQVTNLPWRLESRQLCAHFGFSRLRLINDFQAVGYGLEVLKAEDIVTLQEGVPVVQGPRALMGAGTGLGQGLLVWQARGDSGAYEMLPSEGGHADFAPGTAEQRELLNFLAKRQTRVYVEDVLSGRGLINIYRFLAEKHPEAVGKALDKAGDDAAAAISETGLSGKDGLASQALDLFVAIYANQAANFALTCLATGGVYIAGGIAPKIRARMDAGPFLQAFCNKGPMTPLLEKIPVYLVLDTQVGLKGAAVVASRL